MLKRKKKECFDLHCIVTVRGHAWDWCASHGAGMKAVASIRIEGVLMATRKWRFEALVLHRVFRSTGRQRERERERETDREECVSLKNYYPGQKIETATHIKLQARSMLDRSRACARWRVGCPNFFGQGSRIQQELYPGSVRVTGLERTQIFTKVFWGKMSTILKSKSDSGYCKFTNFRCIKISVVSDHGAIGIV